MRIVLVSSDLAFSSQIRAAVLQQGGELTVAPPSGDLSEVAAGGPVDLVLLDLASAQLDVAGTVGTLRRWSTPPGSILAFGPHVHRARLEDAQAAGCDAVLTRGQLHARLHAIADLLGDSA